MKTLRIKSETIRLMAVMIRIPEGTVAEVITPSHLGGGYVRVTVPQTVELFLPKNAFIEDTEDNANADP